MRRYLISSTNFTGQLELVYDEREQLITVSFVNASMTIEQTEKFIRIIPASESKIGEVFSRYPQLTVVEGSFEVTFDAFWSKYNHKRNRIRASNVWQRLSAVEQVKAYYGVNNYEKGLKKESWRSKADPETYLRNKMWENEY
ncbi:MAG: hypothetical protein QM768_21715 [Agriterribacter sp.]